jgi:hypothetical protein
LSVYDTEEVTIGPIHVVSGHYNNLTDLLVYFYIVLLYNNREVLIGRNYLCIKTDMKSPDYFPISVKMERQGFHGGDYEEWRLLGCYTVWL